MTPTPPTRAEQQARALAIQAHAGQRYGEEPYVHHLAAVRQVLADFDLAGDLAVAAWLHDTLEDTAVTRVQLATDFGERVASLVWAVTGVGPNRKTRIADAHAKIVAFGPEAALLKLADRIANAEASRTNPDKLAMYRKEQPAFEAMIGKATCSHRIGVTPVRPMLERLRAALA